MSTTIARVLTARGKGAYYWEDVAATQSSDVPENQRWTLAPLTPGFRAAREIAETVSVGFTLSSGETVWGDCVGVSYVGKAGREPLLRADRMLDLIRNRVAPHLEGYEVDEFRRFEDRIATVDLPLSVLYGLSQAGLKAAAQTCGVLPAQIVAREWELPLDFSPVPLQGSSGNDRLANTDKMIAHRLAALPHTQVDHLATQFGDRGQVLLDFARWVRRRVRDLGENEYRPVLHYDVHGAVGKVFSSLSQQVAFLQELEATGEGLMVRIESPIVESSREATHQALQKLRGTLRAAGSHMEIVVDEWANTLSDIQYFSEGQAADMIHIKMPDLGRLSDSIDAVLSLKARGLGTLLGGSCIETDLSARLSAQIALATRPDVLLAKPGMGVNEAVSLMTNEMSRAAAQVAI